MKKVLVANKFIKKMKESAMQNVSIGNKED